MSSNPTRAEIEIEYDSNIKLTFSKELYDTFSRRYWNFVSFLIDFGNKMVSIVRNVTPKVQELQLQYSICVKLMFQFFGKLGLKPDKELMGSLLRTVILVLTPFDKAFKKFY